MMLEMGLRVERFFIFLGRIIVCGFGFDFFKGCCFFLDGGIWLLVVYIEKR